MGKSIKRKKRGRPPTGINRMYGLRLSGTLAGQIDSWAKERDVSRSEAIRRLVEIGFKSKVKGTT